MIYAASITTPAATSEANQIDTVLKVTSGLIWMFEVDFPPGCCGLMHVKIFDGLYQALPASVDESLHGDAVTEHFDDLYFKQAAPFELHIHTWNDDDTWDHTVQVRIGMAVSRAEMSRYMPAMAWEDFEKLMVESVAKQEAVRQLQLEASLKELTGG